MRILLSSERTSSCFCLSLSAPTCLLNDCKMFDVSVFLFGVCGGCWLIGSVDDTGKLLNRKWNVVRWWKWSFKITHSIPFPPVANWSSWPFYLCVRTIRWPLELHSMWLGLVEINRLGKVHSKMRVFVEVKHRIGIRKFYSELPWFWEQWSSMVRLYCSLNEKLWQTRRQKRHNDSSWENSILDVMWRNDDVTEDRYAVLRRLFRMHKWLSRPSRTFTQFRYLFINSRPSQ